jgi:thymidylate synthase (FAD)
MKIKVLDFTSENLIALAARQCMHFEPGEELPVLSTKLATQLIFAEHTSLLEHAVIVLQISNVSRAFMTQITRHRMASFTCSSQHYQDASNHGLILPEGDDSGLSLLRGACLTSNHGLALPEGDDSGLSLLRGACLATMSVYKTLLKLMPKETARLVLPNAAGVNIIMTLNAREAVHIMRIRRCKRNVEEMIAFTKLLYAAMQETWPKLSASPALGPTCLNGHCNQGSMTCGKPLESIK